MCIRTVKKSRLRVENCALGSLVRVIFLAQHLNQGSNVSMAAQDSMFQKS